MYRGLIFILALASSANAATSHKIDVGEDGSLKFEPESITAAVGDTLNFHFYSESGPHSVVSSTFEAPCVPNADAFFSGYIDGDDHGKTSFVVNVTSTDPIYFYCSLGRHCQNGMVGAVNAPSGSGVSEYAAAARSVASASAPASAQGGAVATATGGGHHGDDDDSSRTKTSTGGSGSSSITITTGTSGASAATTTAGSTSGGSDSSASVTSDAAGSSGTGAAATTTPSGAGRNSQTPVVLGLAVILGGLVAFMA